MGGTWELWEQTWEAGAAPLPRGKGLGGQSNTQRRGDGLGREQGRRETTQRERCNRE